MSVAWFIGSAVVDVIIHIDHLPQREEDLSVTSQTIQLGGCAYNASDCFSHFHHPYRLLTPIGKGVYGDLVKKAFQNKKIPIECAVDGNQGCCYCLVERDGERTFLAHHGVEYLFPFDLLAQFHPQKDDAIYVSGLEIEEETGDEIISFLENQDARTILFAPGPRLTHISDKRWQRMMQLHPYLHLNRAEALRLAQATVLEDALRTIYAQSGQAIIVTLGKTGSLCFDGQTIHYAPTSPALKVVDTIGAGDNHAGMCLYGLTQGLSWSKILTNANCYARQVLSVSGGQLSEEAFKQLKTEEVFE